MSSCNRDLRGADHKEMPGGGNIKRQFGFHMLCDVLPHHLCCQHDIAPNLHNSISNDCHMNTKSVWPHKVYVCKAFKADVKAYHAPKHQQKAFVTEVTVSYVFVYIEPFPLELEFWLQHHASAQSIVSCYAYILGFTLKRRS